MRHVAGLNRAIAARVASLAENLDLADGICLDGVPALNSGLQRAMGEEMGREVRGLERPQFTVALAIAQEQGGNRTATFPRNRRMPSGKIAIPPVAVSGRSVFAKPQATKRRTAPAGCFPPRRSW